MNEFSGKITVLALLDKRNSILLMFHYRLFLAKFLCFFTGCFVCCYFQRTHNFSPILASALVGFLGSFVHFPADIEKRGIHSVIYAGSFAGMCSLENLPTPYHIFYVSLIGTTIYLLAKRHFTGFGGKLGLVALISSIFLVIGKNLW